MGAAIEKLDFVLSGVLRVVFYRALHIASVPFSTTEVLAYAQENTAGQGRFHGTLHQVRDGPLFTSYQWNDITMGKDVTMDVTFFGLSFGSQTIIIRRRFFLGNFTRDLAQKMPIQKAR